jgi:MFS family permease
VNGLSFLAVIWGLLAMDVPRRERRDFGAAMMRQVRQGVAYVWRHRPSYYLLLTVAISSGFAVQYSVLVPMFARDLLHSGARGYGFLMAAQGFGAVASAIVMNSRSGEARVLRQNLVIGLFLMAISIFVFGISKWMPLSLLAQALIGAGLMNHMVTTNTMLQMFVADELRGRVMSIYTLSFIGTAPLGSLGVGFIGEHMSPRIAVVICSAFALGCAFFLISKLRLIAEAQAELEAPTLAS